jgi:hypothetical protein
MANLWLGQDAGSWHDHVDLGSYISGYVDGGGLVEIVRLAGEMNPSGKRGYPADLIIRSLTKMKA